MSAFHQSIRWRLQLWHSALLVAVLVSFGFTAYWLVKDNLYKRIDAELQLQDMVVGMVNAYPLSLITFGTAQVSRATDQETIGLDIEIEGPLDAFYVYLSDLQKLSPHVAVSTLQLRPGQGFSNTPDGETSIYARLSLWAFWEEEG